MNVVMLLGLVGTAVGLVIGFSKINPGQVADPGYLSTMIGSVLSGLGVTIRATMVSCILAVWLIVVTTLVEKRLYTVIEDRISV